VDVLDLDLGHVAQLTANENSAVALQGIFLGAHEGGAKSLDTLVDAVYPGLEGRGFRDTLVARNAVNVAFAFGAPGAEFVAQEKITDASNTEGGFEGFAVEVGQMGTVWAAADINHHLDAMQPEQLEEMFQRVIRVADGEQLGIHVSKMVAHIL
jgi:hypothetical protein